MEPKTDFGTYISNYADFPTQGILFRDISPLLASQEGMTAAIDRFEESLSCYNIDMIAGIESRGFLFSTLLAMRLKVGSLMIRKPGKLPGDLAFKKYDLEYGSSELTLQKQALMLGHHVRAAGIGEVLSTVTSLHACVPAPLGTTDAHDGCHEYG